jgi:hypothetical protein
MCTMHTMHLVRYINLDAAVNEHLPGCAILDRELTSRLPQTTGITVL